MAIVNGDTQVLVKNKENIEEENEQLSLRPRSIKNFIGQKGLKKNIEIIIKASKKRMEPVPHLLFYGPPGLGKTTIANIIAHEMNGNLKISSGPAIEKTGDLATLLSNLEEGDVFFIDEIHRLKKPIEEVLYSALEDFSIDIIIGKGSSARSMRLQIPKFTLVAATTKLGSMSAPLRDRFGEIFKLEFYDTNCLEKIIVTNAKKLSINITKEAAQHIAKVSRGTPRITNRILHRIRDFSHAYEKNIIEKSFVVNALKNLGIDELGLTRGDMEYLNMLVNKLSCGPAGLSTMASAISEEKGTIEEIIEPFLLQLGFIAKTPKGRIATPSALDHIEKRNKLF